MATVQWGKYWQFMAESSVRGIFDFKTLGDSEVKLACETWEHMANEMFRSEDSRQRYGKWAEAAYAEMVARRLAN